MENINDFGSRLKALGGRLDYPDTYKNKYVDIEEFILDATIYISYDSRLLASVENWIYRFGFIISPSKIKFLISKKNYLYNPATLAVFCNIINQSKLKKINLDCLKQFLTKELSETEVLIDKAIPTRKKNADPLWLNFNLIKTCYKENFKKYLLPIQTIINDCPEIKNRILGIGHVNADYQSYIKKEGKPKSIRALSLIINAQYPTVHQIANKFKSFELIL